MVATGGQGAEAQREFDEITTMGNPTQHALATAAWVRAVLACNGSGRANLIRGTVPSKRGRLYVVERGLPGIAGVTSSAVAKVVVAEYGLDPCWDVFACDVTGSGWWFKSDPEMRAESLLP